MHVRAGEEKELMEFGNGSCTKFLHKISIADIFIQQNGLFWLQH